MAPMHTSMSKIVMTAGFTNTEMGIANRRKRANVPQYTLLRYAASVEVKWIGQYCGETRGKTKKRGLKMTVK